MSDRIDPGGPRIVCLKRDVQPPTSMAIHTANCCDSAGSGAPRIEPVAPAPASTNFTSSLLGQASSTTGNTSSSQTPTHHCPSSGNLSHHETRAAQASGLCVRVLRLHADPGSPITHQPSIILPNYKHLPTTRQDIIHAEMVLNGGKQCQQRT